MLDTLLAAIATARPTISQPVVDAVRNTLTDPALDHAFIAEAVLVPTESFIGDQMKIVDPDAIHVARERLRERLGARRWSRCGARPMPRPPPTASNCRPRPRARGGCARWPWAILMASGAADAPALALQAISTRPTT